MSGAPPPRPPPSGPARPSAPGAAGASGSTTNTPPAPAHPAAQVITNMHNLIAMDKEGKLKPAQILQCRNLIVSHTRSIVLKNTLEKKTNPLLHLTPNLNVLLPFNGSPALISKEAFEKNIAMAAQEGQRIRGLVIPLEELKAMLALPAEERNAKIARDPQLKERFATSVTWYTKGGADGFLPLLTPNRPPGAAGGANTPRPPPGTRPGTPQQAATAGAASSNTNASSPAAAAGAAAVPPPRPSSSSDFKEEADESAASAPKATVKTEPVDPSNAPRTAPAAAADKSGEAQVTKAESSTTANGSAARPPVPTAPAAPPPPPAPPVPVELEEVRRKRKLEKLLAEVAPGAQFELGVTEVFSEVLSCFVDEAARGAAKLAKHRKSEKVGTKDMAYFLDKTYGISIPGFNVQVPQKVHTGPENRENKLDGRVEIRAESKEGKDSKEGKEGRRKMVAPRAARYKAAEGDGQRQ